MSKKILVIVTNIDSLANEPNGTYLPELTHALDALQKNNYEYDIASPNGGAAPHYGGDDQADSITQKMLQDNTFTGRLNNTLPVTC